MAQWRIKEISDLAKVSVRMLRHYDKIGLLKPSGRSTNGYRWYDENDLATLQQIVAFKFFGFSLNQIKTMLAEKLSVEEHLQRQHRLLGEQVEELRRAQAAITATLRGMAATQSPDWQDLVSLIGRYHMTADIKKTWAGRALNEQQLSAYMHLRERHPEEYTLWENIVEEINQGKYGDPQGPDGERIVKIQLAMKKQLRSSQEEQRRLGISIASDIREGKIAEAPLTPAGIAWLAQAGLTYWVREWENLYRQIKQSVDCDPMGGQGRSIASQWRALLAEQVADGPQELTLGIMLWQAMAEQKAELGQRAVAPTMQELLLKVTIGLTLDATALEWIRKALEASAGDPT